MHKSMSGRGKEGRGQNNERLEFLGDAILDAVVGDIVYRHFTHKPEGFLTNTRSKLVQRETLGKLAVEMGLDKLIQSSGRQQTPHSYMAGNAFEALVGAIYLDYGYMKCMQFMEKRILSRIIDIDKVAYKEVNFKSKLLEWTQKNRIRMNFNTTEQRADNGSSVFVTSVDIEGLDCGRGRGYSKKESEQLAAKETLYMLKKQKGLEQSVFDAKSRRTAMEEQPEALLPNIPDEMLEPVHQKPQKQKKQPKPKAEQPKKEEVKQEQPKAEQPKQKEEQSKPKVEQPKQKEEQSKQKAEQPKQQPRQKKEKPAEQVEEPKLDEPKAEEPVKKPRRRRKPQKPAEEKVAEEKSAEQKFVEEKLVEEKPAETPMEEVNAEQPEAEAEKKPKRRRRKPATRLKKESPVATSADAPVQENVQNDAAPVASNE